MTVNDGDSKKSIVRCGSVSQDSGDAFHISVMTAEGHAPVYGLPFTMRDLLPLVARNNAVILTGITHAYRDILMNFVCNLRRLGIYDQLLVAAFDEEAYRFGFRAGLPVLTPPTYHHFPLALSCTLFIVSIQAHSALSW